MGLDMYLNIHDPNRNEQLEIGYWRKANHIHKWFVDNVQGGIDVCKDYLVTIEQLKELKELCKKVLADPHLAESLLPTVSGFFFGSTEYDEHYLTDVKRTIDVIDKALSLPEGTEFVYHPSW